MPPSSLILLDTPMLCKLHAVKETGALHDHSFQWPCMSLSLGSMGAGDQQQHVMHVLKALS